MEYKLLKLSLVVIFREGGRYGIKVQELAKAMPDKTPAIIWPPDFISPGIIEYNDDGIFINIVENRFQIEAKTIKNEIPEVFYSILKNSLEAASLRDIVAFGYNFDFNINGLKSIKEIFKLQIPNTSLNPINGSFLKLSFEKEKTIHNFELSDGDPSSFLHINIHHDEVKPLNALANEVGDILDKDYSSAIVLMEELLQNG